MGGASMKAFKHMCREVVTHQQSVLVNLHEDVKPKRVSQAVGRNMAAHGYRSYQPEYKS